MPVRKIRDPQEMEDLLCREPGSPELLQAIDRVWRFATRTFPRHFPPGVYKYRSIEDAERQRDLWEEADFRALWESRGLKPEDLTRSR
jgi:hypothetical protein